MLANNSNLEKNTTPHMYTIRRINYILYIFNTNSSKRDLAKNICAQKLRITTSDEYSIILVQASIA